MKSAMPANNLIAALALLLAACTAPKAPEPPAATVPPPMVTAPAVTAPVPAPTPPALVIATPPPAPAAPAVATPVTTTPATPAPAPAKVAPPVRTPTPAVTQKAPAAAPPPMALATLEQRLKDTDAIGVFTKIALKNQVDDLLNRAKAHHQNNGNPTLAQLRQSYDQLLGKVHGLLKDGDPALANAIAGSREALWTVLTDPVKFAKL